MDLLVFDCHVGALQLIYLRLDYIHLGKLIVH